MTSPATPDPPQTLLELRDVIQGYARIAPGFETWTLFPPSVPTDR